jgi:hypothetical protein
MRLAALDKLIGRQYAEPFVTSAFHTDLDVEVAVVSMVGGGAAFLLCGEYSVGHVRINPSAYFEAEQSALGFDSQNG